MKQITLFISIFFGLLFSVTAQTIKVEGGLVEGVVENELLVFKGIPFAAPPVGELRWKAPQPVKNWNGVLKADKYASASLQTKMAMVGYTDYGVSEDCLYLNIWKPAQSSDEKLPVLVWIHGGGFQIGSNSQPLTTGEQLAKKGLVVVSIAYRLGVLGFLAHPELTAESPYHASGNYGLLDQLAALKWIKNNITAFGGDTTKITIFGESAGAHTASMLTASPLAKGLFNRVICMSGASFGPKRLKKEQGTMQLLQGAEKLGIGFMQRKGATSIAELRKMDAKNFLKDSLEEMGILWPIIDGYCVIDDQYNLYQQAKYSDIPVLIGINSDEGSIFTMKFKPKDYEKIVCSSYGPFAEKLLNYYPIGNTTVTKKAMSDIFRDSFFGSYTHTWANLQTKTGKSAMFVYYFNQPQPKSFMTMLLKSTDAYHGAACGYVFDHLDQDKKIKYTDADKQLSKLMVEYWVNFAKYGNPNGENLPQWPVYKEAAPTVMYLNSQPKTDFFPNIEKVKLFDEYYQWKRTFQE